MKRREVIRKHSPLPPSQDYDALRGEGMEHVRRLSGELWTDHNLHDPGVTILEALCYALTDLGYRADFGVSDLLAPREGEPEPPSTTGLFLAHEVFPCAPLTPADFRRLLVRIDGVRNAWMLPWTGRADEGGAAAGAGGDEGAESEKPVEAAFYADFAAGSLSFSPTNARGETNPRVRPMGLYRVLLELDFDERLGSLGERRLVHRVRGGSLDGVVLALDTVEFEALERFMDPGDPPVRVADVISVHSAGEQRFKARVVVESKGGTEVELPLLSLAVISNRPDAAADPVEVRAVDLRSLLTGSGTDDPVLLFWEKRRRRRWVIRAAELVLHRHRPLCEDFLSVDAVGTDRIAVCADVEVEGEADVEAVQAQVFHEIEQYLNPPVPLRSLGELLDEGWTPDRIFDGPFPDSSEELDGEPVFTRAGFVTPDDLEATELRTVVHVSDIIHRIMDIEGVISVGNLTLRRYDRDGRASGPEVRWCLTVEEGSQPLLDMPRSRILLFKNEIPYSSRPGELVRTLDHLRNMARKEAYDGRGSRLHDPRGTYRNLHRYHSIQHDLPPNYGVGPVGLAATAEPARIAKARQLKAYLTVFDQVLANHLAQLAGTGRLLSLDETLRWTYFSPYLAGLQAPDGEENPEVPAQDRAEYGIAGVRRPFEDEIYRHREELEDEDHRHRLVETEEGFLERRNRALDHLAARFGERFADYTAMMFRLAGDPLRVGQALIDHKIRFLRECPELARERYTGFARRPGDGAGVWDSDDVSGFERRVARLVGIENYRRRDLHCTGHFDALVGTRKVEDRFRVEIRGRTGAVLFKSAEHFDSREDALEAARPLHPFLRDRQTYRVEAGGGAGVVNVTLEAGGASLTDDRIWDTELEALRAVRAVIDRYDQVLLESEACQAEGFHLFEHILLRPSEEGDPLMDVCLDPEIPSCGDEDPYSFRMTAVLPYWPRRFRNLAFRRLFERTLRNEAPAHVHVRVCWVGNRQMELLDQRYRAWLEEKARDPVERSGLRARTAELIELLRELKSVHPAASLHDCREGGDENVMRLGSTSLGIFHPTNVAGS